MKSSVLGTVSNCDVEMLSKLLTGVSVHLLWHTIICRRVRPEAIGDSEPDYTSPVWD